MQVRALVAVSAAFVSCTSARPASTPRRGVAGVAGARAPSKERVVADAPRTTVDGNPFVAPAGWTLSVRGSATILEPPETGSAIALIDVRASDADAAVRAAWAAYRPGALPPLRGSHRLADREGWRDSRFYAYETSPAQHRDLGITARRSVDDRWTVIIYDMAQSIADLRGGQIALVFDRLQPRGYERETFAGRKAHRLDAARIASLGAFVTSSMKALGVPGAAMGIVQDGEVLFADGFGVRELGKPAVVNGDTLFLIGSNTKALTTLLLATLVDEGKIEWDTPVIQLLPTFRLGDAETTRKVLVKHLVCACTGLPRQDFEWLFDHGRLSPESVVRGVAAMKPTSRFGEMFQYSNSLASVGGFVAGHVAHPGLELGAAFDRAMQARVFDPLGMRSATLDPRRARARNHAGFHAVGLDGKTARAAAEVNGAVVPHRPAGGVWSSARDLLRYVSMELAGGALPDGRRLLGEQVLLARRARQVAIGNDVTYGMGLQVNRTYGIPVVHHGGDVVGGHSDMIWLPDHGVGAVILTNGDPGHFLRDNFRRKLLEVLFDGRPEADATIASMATALAESRAGVRKLLLTPAPAADAARLAARYANPDLGEITFRRRGSSTVLDVGEWWSEVAAKHNLDGSLSFVTVRPGIEGLELLVRPGHPRTLVVRDAQHEYVFVER